MQYNKILMVDDDEEDYILMTLFLKELTGCQISLDWVDTYPKALAYTEDCVPDLIIVDYNLNTSRTGLDLVLELKTSHPLIKAILITGQDKNALLAKRGYSDLDGYIHKNNLNPEILAKTLCPFLG